MRSAAGPGSRIRWWVPETAPKTSMASGLGRSRYTRNRQKNAKQKSAKKPRNNYEENNSNNRTPCRTLRVCQKQSAETGTGGTTGGTTNNGKHTFVLSMGKLFMVGNEGFRALYTPFRG